MKDVITASADRSLNLSWWYERIEVVHYSLQYQRSLVTILTIWVLTMAGFLFYHTIYIVESRQNMIEDLHKHWKYNNENMKQQTIFNF